MAFVLCGMWIQKIVVQIYAEFSGGSIPRISLMCSSASFSPHLADARRIFSDSGSWIASQAMAQASAADSGCLPVSETSVTQHHNSNGLCRIDFTGSCRKISSAVGAKNDPSWIGVNSSVRPDLTDVQKNVSWPVFSNTSRRPTNEDSPYWLYHICPVANAGCGNPAALSRAAVA